MVIRDVEGDHVKPGEILDGEGGYTVFGKLAQARSSLAYGYLPLGLAHDVKVIRPIPKDQPLTWQDVAVDESLAAYELRLEMEALFGAQTEADRSRPSYASGS
jgi:predicted homoserine dehydrogenase-like protein